MTLHNKNGKPLDDLDIIKLRVLARELAGSCAFSVRSEDDVPMLGYLPHDSQETTMRFTAIGWRKSP